jgi:ATP-dependent DNA helicase RecG
MEISLNTDLETLFPKSRTAIQELKKRGIHTAEDLLYFVPRKYLDRSRIVSIAEARKGDYVTCIGTIKQIEAKTTSKGRKLTTAVIFDGTGYLYLVWFGERYIEKVLKEEMSIAVSGNIGVYLNRLQMENPDFDILDTQQLDELSNTGRIFPVYPALNRLSIRKIRKLIRSIFEKCIIDEILPADIVIKEGLLPRTAALFEIHFPSSAEAVRSAQERLKFEEIFILQTVMAHLRAQYGSPELGIAVRGNLDMVRKFISSLPVSLTESQKNAINQLIKDISSKKPMNRLLHGEVGSGKTIVALAAAVYTASGGYQSAFMAPTEVLAVQQFEKYRDYLEKTGVRSGLLISGMRQNEKRETLEKLASGDIDVVFGTHALIYDDVKFSNLGLVIIDEQHRFGTMQRLLLKRKGKNPDILTISATPIPRTLALTVFGDLDVTTLKERPFGRKIEEQIETLHFDYKKRREAYEILRDRVLKGESGFVVVPLVEDSEDIEAKSLREAYEFVTGIIPKELVGTLHGRQDSEEKYETVKRFKSGKIRVLVATTVIEVGVDVPEASIMIIENGERFGLSQLHQLRGRVGRGKRKGTVIILSDLPTEESRVRIETFVKITDGFRLAEEDLKIRGEGEIFGLRQTGPNDLRFTKLVSDGELIEKIRNLAFSYYEEYHRSSVSIKILLEEAHKRFRNLDYIESG